VPALHAGRHRLDRARLAGGAGGVPGVKVALVHDWLTGMRGGERMLERVARMFPDAAIHTLVWRRGAVSRELESHRIETSFLQYLPGAGRTYRWYLPLFPRAIESFRFPGCDVLI